MNMVCRIIHIDRSNLKLPTELKGLLVHSGRYNKTTANLPWRLSTSSSGPTETGKEA